MSKFIAMGFAKLSTREQVLIFALLVLCLPLAIGYCAILPLQDRLRSAERNAIEHSATLNWVAERVEEFPLNSGTNRSAASEPRSIGVSGIEQSLVNFALRETVTNLANRSDDGLDLAFGNVEFALLTDWLDAVSPHAAVHRSHPWGNSELQA